MNGSSEMATQSPAWWHQLAQNALPWLFATLMTVGLTLVLTINRAGSAAVSVTEGQPALDDIQAPQSVTFTSEVLTDQAKEQAAATVTDVYTPLDLSIGRAQLGQARSVFAFIDTVRADTQATKETKLNYLKVIDGLTIENQVGEDILNLSTADFEMAKVEVLAIINELMRQEIQESQLREFRKTARGDVSLELTPSQENVVTNLAPQFIIPTVFPDTAATAEQRQTAVNDVQPVVRTVSKDRLIIRAGDVVTAADIELLTVLGLLQPEMDWLDVGSIFMASLLAVVILTLYWQQFHSRQTQQRHARSLVALALILLIFTLLGRLMAASSALFLYWFPIAAMSMLLAVVFDVRMAILATMIEAALIGFVSGNSLELTVYFSVGGAMALLMLQDPHTQRVNAFFRAGLVAALGYIVVVLIFRLQLEVGVVELLQLVLFGFGNGILSAALTMVGFFIMGGFFGLTTTLQLQELSRLDHPLLKELLRKAPGTYHHSMDVANLAEQAAESIRANGSLVRVGAYYHDIGKMKRPPFFTENQEGKNPHDSLDPASSARIIISHVSDGLELAKKYRLPDKIRDFIGEHHGDRRVVSFYKKALELAKENNTIVDEAQFKHAGPRPRSRESGVVMLADAIEATSTALRPDSIQAIEKLVNTIIDNDLTDGQLDNSNLTLGDIKAIRASFIETLKGRFHARVKYPGNEELEVAPSEPAAMPSISTLSGHAEPETTPLLNVE